MEEGGNHKLAEPGSAAGETHGKAETTGEEMLDDVHCGEVHEAKAEAGEKADGEVEDNDVGAGGDLDVKGGEEKAPGGKENTSQCHLAVAI